VKHARTQGQPQYHPELVRLPKSVDELGERDELFDQSVDIIIESQRGSVSLLQRKLGIGYSRASRLIEQMFAAGIVGDFKNAQAREVVLTKEEWDAIKRQRDSEEAGEPAAAAE
jgi:DNA segregation ATPase FtsK/SpoIIIE, S-DNA-T family